MDYTNIPTGLKITSQLPLDQKEWVQNEATLQDLGYNDEKAFTYYEDLEVLCIDEKTLYKWKEVPSGEEDTGLLVQDFIYPAGLPDTFGINYSNRRFNFFLIEYVTSENIDTYIENFVIINNVGNGAKIYKEGTHFDFKSLTSNTLTILENEDTISIDTPASAQIPALYVNNLYEPSYDDWVFAGGDLVTNPTFEYKGDGTLAKPFTDTVVYTSTTTKTTTPNTAIQNALDNYSGGSRLTPDKIGQQIIIQDNITGYTFSGNFGYSRIRVKIEGNITSSTTGYLIDMDNPLHFNTTDIVYITIDSDKYLFVQGEGFKCNGTTEATNNYTIYRQIKLLGGGYISFTGNDINKYLLTSDKDSIGNGTTGFNNDGAWQFEVRCYLESEFQGLIAIGGLAQILSIGGKFQTGTITSDVDINLKAFYLKGGFLKFRRNSTIIYYGSNTTNRLKLFLLEPTNSFTPYLEQSDCIMAGNCTTLYSKENNNNAVLNINNSGGFEANCTNVFDSTNLWSQASFRNNFLNSGSIDFTKVDLTQGNNISSINTIGNKIIEPLVAYSSKQLAQNNIPKNSKFLNRKTVASGSFVVGQEYQILTVGTTDFVSEHGADSNTVGEWFTAQVVGTGTGTAYIEKIDIV